MVNQAFNPGVGDSALLTRQRPNPRGRHRAVKSQSLLVRFLVGSSVDSK
jgi:hypothetical protein